MTGFLAADVVSVTHERYVLAAAMVAATPSVVVAWLQNRKTRQQNTEQHSHGAAQRQRHQDELLAALTRQDRVRGEQVDGLHTAIGKVEGKLDAHVGDVRVHGRREP